MKVEAKIQKWGNGLALRVSGVMRDIPHFEAGNIVEVDSRKLIKHQTAFLHSLFIYLPYQSGNI